MFKIYRNSDTTSAYVVELVADTLEDIDNLPTTFSPGSDCLCLEDSSVYMLGTDKQWHLI
jgi:hypothetical protein